MLLTINYGYSQGYRIKYALKGADFEFTERRDDKLYVDSLSVYKEIWQTLNALYFDGHLKAKILNIEKKDSVFNAFLYVGPRFEWAYLKSGDIPEILLSKTGFRERFFIHKPFRYEELKNLFEKIIRASENNGYPFAAVGIDSVYLGQDKIHAILSYEDGPLITYDSLIINGDIDLKANWLASYLRLNYNSPFNQSAIENITTKIEQLNFVSMNGPVGLSFQNNQASVTLNLKTVKSNRIDGIIGFLPNAQKEGNLLVTGQLDLLLDNLFHSGKRLNVKWQRLKPLSQMLDLSYWHPNVLNSPLNIKLGFDLLKEDSLYINRNALIALNYQFKQNEITFFTDFRSSRLLSTAQFENQNAFPDASDFNLNYYGVSYGYRNFNYMKSKNSGQSVSVEIAAGTKRVKKNIALPPGVYDNMDLGSQQLRLKGAFEYYFHISKTLVLNHALTGGKIINDKLYLNDLFRLGGLHTLRGFNENFFFASSFGLSDLELQLHYSSGSYLFAFYDQSYIYYHTGQNLFEDYPLGIGVGINLATKGGILSLVYALGYSEDQPLSLRLSKFHFGYIAKF